MNLPQNNSMKLQKVREIVESTNKYNLSPALKNTDGLTDFIMDATSDFPTKTSLSLRAVAIATDNPCTCDECGTVHGNPNRKFCSHRCYIASKEISKEEQEKKEKAWRLNRAKEEAERKYENCEEDYHYVVCCECGIKTYNLEQHVRGFHDIDIKTYKEKYPTATTSPMIKSERILGESNPAYQHDGIYSPFSKKFVNGDVSEETKEKARIGREEGAGYQTRLEYWTSRFGEEEGKKLYHERQSTFNLESLIEKHGEVEGRKIWEERQRKWQETLASLPEHEKILINAKKGFWRYTNPTTDMMDMNSEFNKVPTKLYVIEYQPHGSEKSYIKVGVTSKYLHQRFSTITVKEKLLIHESDRFTNFHIERDIKKFIFENNLSILLERESDKFDGWTECVDIEHKEKLLKVVYEALGNSKQEV